MFSKEDNKTNLSTTVLINDLIDTSTHSSFEEVIIDKTAVEEKETQIPEAEEDIITVFNLVSEGDDNDDNENELINPFINFEEILLKLADKHNQLDEELNKLRNPNKIFELKQTAIAEIINIVSSLPSRTHDSESATISATLLINETLDRILTIYYNKHYDYLKTFKKKTDNFSLNVNNNCVLNNFKISDKEMLNRLIERLILEGQTDYADRKQEPLFYTNLADDRYYIKRDKIIVLILKVLSIFVKYLLELIPILDLNEETIINIETEQDKINSQIDMIFAPLQETLQEPLVSTKRRSKRRT